MSHDQKSLAAAETPEALSPQAEHGKTVEHPTLTVVNDLRAGAGEAVEKALRERPEISESEWREIKDFLKLIEEIERAVQQQNPNEDWAHFFALFEEKLRRFDSHPNVFFRKIFAHDVRNDISPIYTFVNAPQYINFIVPETRERTFKKAKIDFKSLQWWVSGEQNKIPVRTVITKNFQKEFEDILKGDFAPYQFVFLNDDNPKMRMNTSMVLALMRNIVRNAKMRGKATQLFVHVKVVEEKTVIEIMDNGMGIQDDVAGKIFEYGFSGHKSTGIGLALAPERMASMGGKIHCEPHGGLKNEKEGQGAKFVIELESK